MKSYDEALKVDERYRIIMAGSSIADLRPMTFQDHYDMVAALALPTTTPEIVERLYSRALNAFLFAWLDYELMVVAAGQALATLEFALKIRLGGAAKTTSGLARRLAIAVEQQILSSPQPGPWGDDHVLLAQIRNEIAHGSDHVYDPNMTATIFHHCRVLICELNGLPAPGRGFRGVTD
ncbi:hypothetical protein [Brevundimonas sp.]|uniref:hypothetical protein n=1 Tax=Brevundimonas sp. TaxID=1871086 RepID=UPI002896A5DD|nr:hypothetical protein [Brevundimonas sp.]